MPSYDGWPPLRHCRASRSTSATSATWRSPPPSSPARTTLVTTVHPLSGDRESQRRVGLDGTLVIAEAAVSAGVPLWSTSRPRRSTTVARGSVTSPRTVPWWPTTPTTTRWSSATSTRRWVGWRARPGCWCDRRRSSDRARRRSGTPSSPLPWPRTSPAGTRSPTRPSPGCTSTTWPRSPRTSPRVSSPSVTTVGRSCRRRLHPRQRRQRTGHAARLPRRRHLCTGRRADMGRQAGVDRTDPRRPRTRLGLDAEGLARRCARRAPGRPAPPVS